MDDLGYDEVEVYQKIGQITAAFYNQQVIRWLQERGSYIQYEKWDDAQEVNDEIANTITTDGELLDLLQTPCAIFVTFENEEGYNRALKLNQQVSEGVLKPHF